MPLQRHPLTQRTAVASFSDATGGKSQTRPLTLRLKIAQKPHIVWSLGPKALKYESLEP